MVRHTQERKIREFQKTVLDHFKKHGRDLPWRNTKDPYHIVVSEIMLQQTQVDRVIPFFTRFIAAFPDWKALSEASFGQVYPHWQGLGYNRRARALIEMAKEVQKRFAGVLPADREELLSLPGIGPYTAGAILTFAYNTRAICIETNIRTVFTHHFFSSRKKVSDKEIELLVEKTFPKQQPRVWYAALMDYGSYLKKQGVRLNARSASYKKQKAFAGSVRQIRGAILRELLRSPLSREEIRGSQTVQRAIDALLSEGLIELRNERLTLPS